MTCSSGTGWLALYLDGVPVPGSAYRVPDAAPANVRAVGLGVTVNVSPGSQKASIGLDCPSGTLNNRTHTDSRWFVLTPTS